MSYNLLCKLFGRTFASQICGNYSITCFASYLVIHLLTQIYDNYCNSCSTSAGLWFACVRTEMPA